MKKIENVVYVTKATHLKLSLMPLKHEAFAMISNVKWIVIFHIKNKEIVYI